MKKHDTKIVGILNITPDSYSDGGKYQNVEKAITHTKFMIDSGVDVIDVGAESTRPNGKPVSQEEESCRLNGVIEKIYEVAKSSNIKVSLDSRNYRTLEKFSSYYDIVNDVTGLNDLNILSFCKNNSKPAIFMRSVHIPVRPSEILGKETDVMKYIQSWLDNKLEFFQSHNLSLNNLIFDPGVGFGLGAEKDFDLLRRIDELDTYKIPMMLGYSRKSFLKKFGECDASKRDPETHVITSYLIDKKVDYLRLHNVRESVRVIKLAKELYR